MKRKMGIVMAIMLFAIGIIIMFIPLITQQQTKQSQNNLKEEYEKIIEENKQSKEEKKEPKAQQDMDYTVADFSEEKPKETNKEVATIIDRQEILGKIFCEKIGIEFVVVEGAERDNIRATIGHISGTAGIGGKGNCVLAGHRGGYYGVFFKNIHLLEKGDKVILTDVYNREYIYEMYEQFVVEPTELWVCDKIEGENTLTLLSCEENGTKRIIVRCRLRETQNKQEKD